MKRKVMAMILMCALLAVNLTGCGNRTADEGQVQEQGQTEGTDNAQGDAEQEQEEPAQEETAQTEEDDFTADDPLEVLTQVWNSYTEEERFEAAGGDRGNMVTDAPGSYDLSDAAAADAELSVPEDALPLIQSAASLMHMLLPNTFTCGAYATAGAVDSADLATALRDHIQEKHWLDVIPDKLVILSLDNCIVAAYGKEDLINAFRDKVQESYPEAYVVYEEAIE